MDVSIVIPALSSEGPGLAACLAGLVAQQYPQRRIEVLVVHYGGGHPLPLPARPGPNVRLLTVTEASPYAARNRAAAEATGEVFVFTEPGCVPDPGWVGAHVSRLDGSTVTISVGHVAPARATRLVELFVSYEDVRDVWAFSHGSWRHRFGRPNNMAVARRRFETHGPFAEVARGADSTLVQRVAREISCAEIGLTPHAVVRQQSIRGLPSCFRDRFLHARALRRHRSSHAAPIALVERARLFRETVRLRRYGPLEAATLLLLLVGGTLTFRAGGWCGVSGHGH